MVSVKLPIMGKMLKYGRVVGAGVALAAVAAVGIGAATALNPASAPEPTPTAVVETVDFGAIPYTNGLASEQEAEAAAVVAEQARVAAEQAATAEAARVAAEQAAAAEAEQVATESEPETDEPVDEWANKTPVPFIVDPNPENAAGGFYDTSQCPSGSASTGPDGVPYCD